MFTRRDFLKAVVVTAGGTIVGCDSGDGGGNNNNNNTGGCGPIDNAALQTGDAFFPQSVASGDPKEDAVILWTRLEDSGASGDLQILLQVSRDDTFTDLLDLGTTEPCTYQTLTAEEAFDHCVKVRLTGLDSATTYYYRFIYEQGGTQLVSRTGRTKTAPAADADVPVRFAFVSCQDFNGRYYNPYKRLLQEDLDFVVHLGDYVYETTGDPLFQQSTPDRRTTFADEAGAIVFHPGDPDEFFAASALSNYRDLYKTYRSDQWLQQVHERYPMICVWDDHEYSDDCFGATATYFDGSQDEQDVTRRQNANKAWFEFMPVDYLDAPDFRYDETVPFPNDIRIYRDIRYGANMHLVMTDLRSYRPDHVIPEDLFPGAVLLDETELTAEIGAPFPPWADQYFDVASYMGGMYQQPLIDAAPLMGYDPAFATGNFSVRYANRAVDAYNQTVPPGSEIALINDPALPTGLTAASVGKMSMFSAIGSRYLVVKDAWNVYANKIYNDTGGASQHMMGAEQESWFLSTMQGSNATWKVWGNEFCLVQRAVDLRPLVQFGELAQLFLLSAEDWDGFTNKRDELIDALSQVGNVVAVTGDIHAFFAGNPMDRRDPSKRIVELVSAGISSASYQTLLFNQASSDPALVAAGADQLALLVEDFLFSPATQPNPPLAYGDVDVQGFAVVELDSAELNASFYGIEETNVQTDLPENGIDSNFTVQRFRVDAGSPDLYGEFGGVFQRWDPTTLTWV